MHSHACHLYEEHLTTQIQNLVLLTVTSTVCVHACMHVQVCVVFICVLVHMFPYKCVIPQNSVPAAPRLVTSRIRGTLTNV